MTDITWCASPDCVIKCDRHITRCDADPNVLVSTADFSGVCRTYIGKVVDEVKNDLTCSEAHLAWLKKEVDDD